jgi:hypothetical protein
MIHDLKFTAQEMELLAAVLESKQRDLAVEVAHTESLTTKAELRKRERVLDRLVERVRAEVETQRQTA